MKKGAKVWSFIVILTVVGLMFSGLIDTTSATTEKTTVSVTDSSPWFTKGTNSGSGPWYPHTYEGHDYISTYVGGMSSNPSQPDCWAKFKPYLSQSGKYEVYAHFYACKDTSTKVPFTVKYDGGSTTIKVNQYRSSPAWKEEYLGTWYFKAGAETYVKVTDATGEPYDGCKGLTIGAIKFAKKETVPTPTLTPPNVHDIAVEHSEIPILNWPLKGEIENRRILLGFGDIWTWTYCGGLPKKHTGVDLKANVGEDVYAACDGVVKKVYSLSSKHNWGKGVVIEHSGFTTTYMHVNPVVNEGAHVNKGQKIAIIGSIDGDEHLHFGVRNSAYSDVSKRGALPQKHGDSDYDKEGHFTGCKNDHLFPEKFIDPMKLKYGLEKSETAPKVAKPVLTYPLKITPEKDKYYVGDTITARFSITNKGTKPITLDKLLVGGRFNDGKLPNGEFPDFTPQSTTLPPNGQYTGTLTLTQPGNYHFFVAYYIENPTTEEKKLLNEYNWNTCVDLGDGLTDEDRIEYIEVFSLPEGPYIDNIAPTSGAPGIEARIKGENFDNIVGIQQVTFGFLHPTEIIDWSDREIVVVVPPGEGTVDVTASAPGRRSNSVKFTYKEPTIDFIHPLFGKTGTLVTIRGRDFGFDRSCISPSYYVRFGCSDAHIVSCSWTDTEIVVEAPSDYGTGENDRGLLIGLIDLALKGYGVDFPISKEILDWILIKLSNCEIVIPPAGGRLEVDVRVTTPTDTSNAAVFTYRLSTIIKAYLCSPGELRVYDSLGRVTGLVNGEVKEEIPYSLCDGSTVMIVSPQHSYRYKVVGTDEGTYGLRITSVEDGKVINFTATDIPTTVGAIHQYTINWAALSQGEKGVTVKIDSDGDDVVEHTIITNNSFYPLIAEFTFSPKNPLIGEKVTLDASTSFDLGGGVIKKYCWEFYNAANQDPFYVIEGHDKKIIRYTFTSEGIYLVRLTVTDDEGEYSYTESSISIKAPIKEPVFYVPDDYPSIQAAVDAANAGDTIIVRDGTYTENVAVNKRLTIQSENGYKNCIVKAAKSNEDVFTVTADYGIISGFTVKGALTEWDYTSYGGYAGIYLDHVNYCNISNNNALNNHNGIHLRDSSHICITNNNVQLNKNDGIFLSTSSNNIIDNNKASLITLWWSSNNNVLTNNNATISLYFASNNILTNNKGSEINLRSYSNNNIANNNIIGAGILLDSCSNNSILTNTLEDKGISIYGRNLSHFNTHIIKDNVINGKPIYYYKNIKGIKVTETGGQIIIANCSNIIVENISNGRIDLAYTNDSKISNNNVSKIEVRYSSNDTIANNNVSNGDGINIGYSSNNKIISNNVSNNSYGIFIGISSNNIIVNNIVNSNINDGITLDGSPDNVIYFNNFVGNGRNVCAYGLNNIWNSPAPITYTYNGNTYTNYLGNYWDDYTDVDTDNDGIWDNPYSINWDSLHSINSDQDHYPLVTWSEHYFNPSPTIPTPPTSTLTPTPRPTLTPTPRPTLRPTATLFI